MEQIVRFAEERYFDMTTRRTVAAADREIQAMTEPRLAYFSEEDVLHLVISEDEEANSVEVSPNITAELNDRGELIGIEILHASAFVRDSIMEGVQAKILKLVKP
jgi:uncharacterized protein YuzE